MASSTPISPFDASKEKEWAANLGTLDWDNTSIVFTKRSLIEFLKYAGVTIDTNFTSIQKLPRYAQIGKLGSSEVTAPASAASPPVVAPTTQTVPTAAGGFKPSRRVRTVPGGVQTISLFGDDDDAPVFPPSRPPPAPQPISEPPNSDPLEPEMSTLSVEDAEDVSPSSAPKPSRRVREIPGGKDSIAGFFADEPHSESSDAPKPSRRVRSQPGGASSGLW